MTAAWIGYCLLVSATLGLAALLAERALGQYRKPVRWVWVGAIAGSLLLPGIAYLIPSAFLEAGPPLSIELLPLRGSSGPPGDALVSEHTGGFEPLAWLGPANALLVGVWIGSILLLGGYLAMMFDRLRGEMRSWTPGRILGAPVLLSPDRGPAVIGLRRSVIVLPRWIAELRDDVLRLVFLHEREHQIAGDQRLFVLAVLGTLAMPWNPIMWWQLRRLRLAIEFDCDHRVIARGVAPREYAEALLEIGSRVSHPPLAAAAFAERRSAVERRLRRLTQPLSRLRGPSALLAATGAALLIGVACRSPVPPSPVTDADESPQAEAVSAVELTRPQLDDPSDRPSLAEGPSARLGAEPVFVIDGVVQPLGTSMAQIDREDIERIEIIETEAAQVLYGDRAAQGIISITTRAAAGEATDADLPPLPPLATIKEATPEPPDALIPEPPDAATPEPPDALIPEPTDAATPEPVPEEPPSFSLRFREEPPALITEPDAAADPRRTPRLLEPLLLIDGVTQDDFAVLRDMDPGAIDSIEVLKGPAAIRIYGPLGSNGVIRVTTKKP